MPALILRISLATAMVFAIFLPATASAGPIACAKAIATCGKGGVKSAKQIKATRSACEALRDCKVVCRVDKRAEKRDNRGDKRRCITGCNSKRGKAKKQCKRSCRSTKRSGNQGARTDKRQCVRQCRADYKTPACKGARTKLMATLALEGLKCAASVAAACPTAIP